MSRSKTLSTNSMVLESFAPPTRVDEILMRSVPDSWTPPAARRFSPVFSRIGEPFTRDRHHDSQVAAMATITGVEGGAWSDKASSTGHRDGHDRSPSLEPRSGDRSEAGGASHRSPRWDNPIPCLVPHRGNGTAVVRGLVSTRRGSEELGTIAPFWPGACATNLRFAAPFGSWLQGPGANLQWGRGDETVEDVLRDKWISQCRSLLCPRGSHGTAPACMEASARVSWL